MRAATGELITVAISAPIVLAAYVSDDGVHHWWIYLAILATAARYIVPVFGAEYVDAPRDSDKAAAPPPPQPATTAPAAPAAPCELAAKPPTGGDEDAGAMRAALIEQARIARQRQQHPPRPGEPPASAGPPLPTVEQQLTVVITTSPIMSHPSTAMLEEVLDAFNLVPQLVGCRTLIVCDGYKLKKVGTGKRGSNNQSKRGIVTEEVADRYGIYIGAVKKLAAQRVATEVLIMPKHVGFAYAVKAALQDGGAGGPVKTQFVMVVQHDYKFVKGFDLSRTLDVMRRHSDTLKCQTIAQSCANMP